MKDIESSNVKAAHERYLFKPYYGSSHWWALQKIKNLPVQTKVLDVGPGEGEMGKILKSDGIKDLNAVEIDPETIKILSGTYKEIKTKLKGFQKKKFDLVFLMDVLEHMTEPEKFIDELNPLLNKGAIVLISLPNFAHWSVRVPLIFGYYKNTNRGIPDKTHYRIFTRSMFKELIKHFKDTTTIEISSSIEPAEFVLPEYITKTSFFKFGAKVRLFLAKNLPGFFAYQHLAILKKNT